MISAPPLKRTSGAEHFGYHSRCMPALYVKLGGNFAAALAVRVTKIGLAVRGLSRSGSRVNRAAIKMKKN